MTKYVKPGEFYGTVSAERAAQPRLRRVPDLRGEPTSDMTTFSEDPLIGKIPALADGHAYAEVDKNVGLAVTNPIAAVDPGHHRGLPPGASPRRLRGS